MKKKVIIDYSKRTAVNVVKKAGEADAGLIGNLAFPTLPVTLVALNAQKGVTTALASPWHFQHMHVPLGAADPRDIGVQVGLVLPEIQVSPAMLAHVMDMDTRAAAFPAGWQC